MWCVGLCVVCVIGGWGGVCRSLFGVCVGLCVVCVCVCV